MFAHAVGDADADGRDDAQTGDDDAASGHGGVSAMGCERREDAGTRRRDAAGAATRRCGGDARRRAAAAYFLRCELM